MQQLRDDIGVHGHPMSEATDPMGRPGVKDEPGGFHWVAERVGVDYAAQALQQEQDAFYDGNPDADRAHDIWVLRKAPDRLTRPRRA